ncbi:MAG: sodium:proton antiporter NhaD [Tannerellaceae bacterium]|jgi:Na+/H+ antiporter NhaD/arsenite permease-like protein|nr:sodium:proton antiporter NhaD [Tannerellaceae bacterium]
MFIVIPVIFILGIIAIALEDKLNVNKAAVALVMAIILWIILMLDAYNIFVARPNHIFQEFLKYNPGMELLPYHEQFINFITNRAIIFNLGNVTETLFFVMGAILIVDLVDKHGGFLSISDFIATTNKRKLLWWICLTAFFLAPLLDNMAAAIVLMAVLRKLVFDRADRLKYACMIIIAANAGGSFSPIGDVTTILLWVGKNITPLHQITHVFLPALAHLLIPLTIATFILFKKSETMRKPTPEERVVNEVVPTIPASARRIILIIGVLSLALVPVFQNLTALPPFLGVLMGLAVLWFYTDIMYSRMRHMRESRKMRVITLLPNVDLATIFFFLGILMSVGALETSGHLSLMSNFLDAHIHAPYLTSFLIGILSSCVDNVALVAATIGMYPIQAVDSVAANAQYFVADGGFWTFLTYCGVTGGSLLIIGSATGVIVMGMEKIEFTYYAKKFSLLAFSGYLAGALTFLAFNS